MNFVARPLEIQLPDDRLWEAVDRLPCGVAMFDGNDHMLVCNSRFRTLFAAVDETLVTGLAFERLFRIAAERRAIDLSGDTLEAWLAGRADRARDGAAPTDHVLSGRRHVQIGEQALRNGGSVLVVTEVTALREGKRALANRVVELEETQRVMAEQERELKALAARLAASRDDAERANKTKSEFLANMSHELRSPLNAIIGFAEIMKGEMFGPLGNSQYQGYARDIWSSGTHLLSLINDILDLSKIEAGKLSLQDEIVNIGHLIGTCVRLVATRAAQAEVTVTTSVDPDLPPLRIDSRKGKQIVLNLLSNAVKFTPPGGAVRVSARRDADGDILIAVIDNGIGMASDEIPRALEPFGQVDSSLARKYEGTGLGLPLARALAELHGGALAIESAVGAGTTATIRFPASRLVKSTESVKRSASAR